MYTTSYLNLGTIKIESLTNELKNHQKDIISITTYLSLPQYKPLQTQLIEVGDIVNTLTLRIDTISNHMLQSNISIDQFHNIQKEFDNRLKISENNKEKLNYIITQCDLSGTIYLNIKEIANDVINMNNIIHGSNNIITTTTNNNKKNTNTSILSKILLLENNSIQVDEDINILSLRIEEIKKLIVNYPLSNLYNMQVQSNNNNNNKEHNIDNNYTTTTNKTANNNTIKKVIDDREMIDYSRVNVDFERAIDNIYHEEHNQFPYRYHYFYLFHINFRI